MSEEQAEATQTNDRPMIVFVYDADVDEQRYQVEEQKAFFDDKVAVGARFFDCLRIDLESAKTDRALAKSVKKGSTLVFLSSRLHRAQDHQREEIQRWQDLRGDVLDDEAGLQDLRQDDHGKQTDHEGAFEAGQGVPQA